MVKSRRRNTTLTSKENIVPESYDKTTVSNATEFTINMQAWYHLFLNKSMNQSDNRWKAMGNGFR